LLACASNIAEEESVERDSLAVYSWVKGCVYTIFAALLTHVSESRVVSW
jgi:hypothetical protein